MTAEAHLEVYRRFQGELRESRLRFTSILGPGLRIALKQRLALLLLYGPIGIATIIFSSGVYAKFVLEAQNELQVPESSLDLQARLIEQVNRAQFGDLIEVVTWMIRFNIVMGVAAVLAVAWFGSGLFCEDRKAGAHQLYFARPITRLDYFLGKFSIAAFFSLCAMLVPMLVISLVAAVTSPEWSFVKEEWDVFPRAIAFSLTWTVVIVSLVLLASSLAPRRSFALVGVFAVSMISEAASGILGGLVDQRLFAIGIVNDLNALCYHIFGKRVEGPPVSASDAWLALCVLVALCWLVIAARLRRLEVVA